MKKSDYAFLVSLVAFRAIMRLIVRAVNSGLLFMMASAYLPVYLAITKQMTMPVRRVIPPVRLVEDLLMNIALPVPNLSQNSMERVFKPAPSATGVTGHPDTSSAYHVRLVAKLVPSIPTDSILSVAAASTNGFSTSPPGCV